MTKIKIKSDPYNRSLSFLTYKDSTEKWEDVKDESINSKLRENDSNKIFLPFIIKDIIDTIISEYYVGNEKIMLIFEGTDDEYDELINICKDETIGDKIELVESERYLENARDILDHAKKAFETVQPIIKSIVKDNADITGNLNKVSDALNDIIPICVFGNYSAGKSTFINSLIGYEILPSGGDPVTSKVYEIKRSKHEDRAKVSFSYLNEEFELLFDNVECWINVGNKDNELIQVILKKLSKIEDNSLFMMVNKTVDVLNFFEKKDKNNVVISDVIRIEVPFSENGKLGQSLNKYVIFDTPGSNSNTNHEHQKVLVDSLRGFSNGIPVWVSGYDSIDSVDNATLCDLINEIDALDKRFTMIVINKADSSELPKNGFKEEDIRNIMEYESVDKMYSSGIYFVSSVMGLGAKNYDGIVSEYLLDVFDEKKPKFSDPTVRSYKKLYEYNIMPEQIKRKAVNYSVACNNLIYANSGMYCVEMEMEQFASKYAAYNKCQMVYMFLKSIIDETNRKIKDKTASLEKDKAKREQELDTKKRELIDTIGRDSQNAIRRFDKDSKSYISQYVKDNMKYEIDAEELGKSDDTLNAENEESANYSSYEQDYETAKNNRVKNFFSNLGALMKHDLSEDGLKEKFQTLTSDLESDSKVLKEKKERKEITKRDIDKATSDSTLQSVRDEYRVSITDAQEKLIANTKNYWQNKSQEYRDEMVRLIIGADSLSESQRSELSAIIMNYPAFTYNDDSDKVFIKEKFLRGNFFGQLSERLNTKRLASIYNSSMRRNVKEMSERINENCFVSFKEWQSKLQALIEDNIAQYNPELREISEFIREETDRILELQSNQQSITNSMLTIENMMSWKEPEQE